MTDSEYEHEQGETDMDPYTHTHAFIENKGDGRLATLAHTKGKGKWTHSTRGTLVEGWWKHFTTCPDIGWFYFKRNAKNKVRRSNGFQRTDVVCPRNRVVYDPALLWAAMRTLKGNEKRINPSGRGSHSIRCRKRRQWSNQRGRKMKS